MVILVESQLHKDDWPVGVIKDCRTEIDGLVRTVVVRTNKGDVLRDIRKICLLEGENHTGKADATDQAIPMAADTR